MVSQQPRNYYDVLYFFSTFFFGPRNVSPMLAPVNLTLAAFWSLLITSCDGISAPARSIAATLATSTFAFTARSFCVIVVPF